jgi:hypothetical protein
MNSSPYQSEFEMSYKFGFDLLLLLLLLLCAECTTSDVDSVFKGTSFGVGGL